ncbi:MAG: phytoene/squalene synthase family protein [Acidimicrobiales bacterium]
MNLDEAYACCETITRTEARNFSYGIRLLPPPKRKAMSAIYAMARRIDDIGDGDLAPPAKLDRLAAVRKRLAQLPGRPGPGSGSAAGPAPDPAPDPAAGLVAGREDEDPVLVALDHASWRFPIPMEAFDDLVEGCEMDASGTTYQSFDQLVGYCRRVAGSIGRLSLGVFGATDLALAMPRADALGVALQVTNILRDLVEDRDALGRVYLPAEDIDRFGLGSDLSGSRDDLAALVIYEARRARPFWEEGLSLLALLDRRSRACVAAMAGIYRRLADQMERRPAAVLETRLSLPRWEKAAVAARALAGRGA